MSKKASSDAMEALHGLLAKEMANILVEGVTAVDKESGEVSKLTPGANYLNVIRQFLKDNSIETAALSADPASFSKFVDKALPFLRKDDGEDLDATQ